MDLVIITFNLRFDKPDLNEYNWRRRKEAIASLIRHYQPDLIGTQEGKAHQLLDLHRLLPSYQSIGGDRSGTGNDEHCAIFYHLPRWKCLETGDFYLSETPTIAGSITPAWGNPQPRMTSWGKFISLEQEQEIILFNTHLDYRSAKARELGAQLICDRLEALSNENVYFFLTGDFNAAPESLPREKFKQSLAHGIQLKDVLANRELTQQMTYHEFTGEAFDAVDTIYYDSRVRLTKATIDSSKPGEILPSDHFPVIANFLIT